MFGFSIRELVVFAALGAIPLLLAIFTVGGIVYFVRADRRNRKD